MANRMIVQIYEVQSPVEADALMGLGVDHIGSVIPSREQWQLPGVRETIRCVAAAGAASSLIPLFSDLHDVCNALDYYRPDIVHFCETIGVSEDEPHRIDSLIDLQIRVKRQFPQMRIMRSVPIAETGMARHVPTLELARLFEPVSDIFLTDTLLLPSPGSGDQRQPVQGFVGITGRTCDWDMARQLVQASTIPVILAGGITPENVAEGMQRVNPFGVDSCTGTNATDQWGGAIRFKKDLDKVRRLVASVRGATAAP